MAKMTKEEFLEKLFHDDYRNLKGKKLRMTRVRVPGKEVCLAHVINPSDARIYQNLALHIESVVVAADVAVKSAHVEIGFMDRFCGSLILTGGLSEVQTAVEEVVRFFDQVLGFKTCEIHRS